ncbi:MAG: NapC/NirT family cytochrome c [Blastocatellia bacterium]|nr:NapC/NirT family cytochrome c [Blastocatellia bacterium]
MPWSTTLIAIILVAIALTVLLAARPSLTITKAGKILAFLSLFIFPIMAGTMGVFEHIERSKSTEFCTSCHVMEDYGKSLRVDDFSSLPATHFQYNRVPRDRACYTCHTDYAMYGDFRSKLRGLKHVYVQYLGTVPQEVKLYTPYNNRECLHCHAGARGFEEGATHTAEEGRLQAIKSNQMSCMTSGCHDMSHNIKGLKDATFWPATAKQGDAGDTGGASDAGASNETGKEDR